MIFFIISKLLSILFSPLTWIIILLALGLLLKRYKHRNRFFLVAFLLILLFSNTIFFKLCIKNWEYPAISYSSIKDTFDVGIVLGGGMVTIDNKIDRITFRNNTDRIMQGVFLLRKGYIKQMIISSGAGTLHYRNMLEADLLKRFFVEANILDSTVIVESKSDNTYQNAVYSAKILKEKAPKGKYLLITSALHMKRAKACFAKQGITVDVFPTNNYVGNEPYLLHEFIVPNYENFNRWHKFIHEIIGYFTYLIMGYI